MGAASIDLPRCDESRLSRRFALRRRKIAPHRPDESTFSLQSFLPHSVDYVLYALSDEPAHVVTTRPKTPSKNRAAVDGQNDFGLSPPTPSHCNLSFRLLARKASPTIAVMADSSFRDPPRLSYQSPTQASGGL